MGGLRVEGEHVGPLELRQPAGGGGFRPAGQPASQFVLCNIQNMSRCLHVPYMPYTPSLRARNVAFFP